MTVQDIYNAVLAFDKATATAQTQAELDAGTDISLILNDGLISAMDEVGDQFARGDLFVPEMLRAAQAMKAGMELLKPHLSSDQSQGMGQESQQHGKDPKYLRSPRYVFLVSSD